MDRARKPCAKGRYPHRNRPGHLSEKGPEHFSSEDAQVISYVQELLRTHRASEATFQALYARLGEKGLVELTATIGYYAMVACTLNAFDLVTASGAEEFKIG
jgi:hypothetical protein